MNVPYGDVNVEGIICPINGLQEDQKKQAVVALACHYHALRIKGPTAPRP